MTPLLNAAVYYFIFGVLLGTSHGVPDFIPFLVTGVFIWTFTSNSIQTGTRAISGSLGLVRALHFPRASLPIAYAVQQLQQLLFSMGALIVILVCFGEYPKASWLLAIPALVLQAMFNTGLSMVMARLAAKTPDVSQLMPFILRTWMYVSGVMWSIKKVLAHDNLPHLVLLGLQCNPAAVYIDLMRYALIGSYKANQLPRTCGRWPSAGRSSQGWAASSTSGRQRSSTDVAENPVDTLTPTMTPITVPAAPAGPTAPAAPTVIADDLHIVYKIQGTGSGKGSATSALNRIVSRKPRPGTREVHAVRG